MRVVIEFLSRLLVREKIVLPAPHNDAVGVCCFNIHAEGSLPSSENGIYYEMNGEEKS
jgi:hypothetical protein